jgi:phage tail-like protein
MDRRCFDPLARRLLAAGVFFGTILAAAPARAQPTGSAQLEFGSTTTFVTSFTNVGSQSEVISQKIIVDGTEVIRKVPGRLTILDVVLARGITVSLDLANWRKQIEDGNIASARRSGTLTLFDETFKPLGVWNLANCWPSALVVSTNPTTSATETLTLACEGVIRVK